MPVLSIIFTENQPVITLPKYNISTITIHIIDILPHRWITLLSYVQWIDYYFMIYFRNHKNCVKNVVDCHTI